MHGGLELAPARGGLRARGQRCAKTVGFEKEIFFELLCPLPVEDSNRDARPVSMCPTSGLADLFSVHSWFVLPARMLPVMWHTANLF